MSDGLWSTLLVLAVTAAVSPFSLPTGCATELVRSGNRTNGERLSLV